MIQFSIAGKVSSWADMKLKQQGEYTCKLPVTLTIGKEGRPQQVRSDVVNIP